MSSLVSPIFCLEHVPYMVLHETCFYLQYELIFCIEEDMDPAVMVVRSLLEKYPKVDAKLFIGK